MKKQIIAILAGVTLFSTVGSPVAARAQTADNISMSTVIDDKEIDVEISENEFTITDKSTQETATVIFSEENPILIDENGNETELLTTKDDKGNIYVNGELVGTQVEYYDEAAALTDSREWDLQDNTNMNIMGPSLSKDNTIMASTSSVISRPTDTNPRPSATYQYAYTTETNAYIRAAVSSMATAIVSLITLSRTIAVMTIIEAIAALRTGMIYIRQHTYHTSGYRYYRYNSYFYKNSNYTGFVDSTVQWQTMW